MFTLWLTLHVVGTASGGDGDLSMRAYVHSCVVMCVCLFRLTVKKHIVHSVMHLASAFRPYLTLLLCAASVCSAVDTGLS